MELQGCGTAIVTPFRADSSIDEPALYSLVNWQIESGIQLLIACGSTGEAATLSDSETHRVVEIIVEASGGRIPVFAGCTHNSTREAVSRAQKMARIGGLTGILTASPFYNKPSQEGQYLHFKAIAEAVSLPIMLYNVPGRTGTNLEPATVLRLAEMHNVVAIKESSGNITQITELLNAAPRTFRVFVGDDGIALPGIAVGCDGLISVASNVIPAQMSQMVNAALSNDWATARRINRHFFKLMQAHFWESSPGPVKAVMEMIGRINGTLRLPMTSVTPATHRKLEILVGELGLLVAAPAGSDNLRMF